VAYLPGPGADAPVPPEEGKQEESAAVCLCLLPARLGPHPRPAQPLGHRQLCVSKNAGDPVKAWYSAVSALQMQGMVDAGEQVPAPTAHPVMQRIWGAERAHQADILRCIFGNPFRPVTIDPAWLTPDVVALVQAADDERLLPSGEPADGPGVGRCGVGRA
jgi:hypothetical protein